MATKQPRRVFLVECSSEVGRCIAVPVIDVVSYGLQEWVEAGYWKQRRRHATKPGDDAVSRTALFGSSAPARCTYLTRTGPIAGSVSAAYTA